MKFMCAKPSNIMSLFVWRFTISRHSSSGNKHATICFCCALVEMAAECKWCEKGEDGARRLRIWSAVFGCLVLPRQQRLCKNHDENKEEEGATAALTVESKTDSGQGFTGKLVLSESWSWSWNSIVSSELCKYKKMSIYKKHVCIYIYRKCICIFRKNR